LGFEKIIHTQRPPWNASFAIRLQVACIKVRRYTLRLLMQNIEEPPLSLSRYRDRCTNHRNQEDSRRARGNLKKILAFGSASGRL